MDIPSLDEIVLKSLSFFEQNAVPSFDVHTYSLPFVVGSGNAINTGKILFSPIAAVYADESDFRRMVSSYAPIIKQGLIKDCVVISASGEKDSVWELTLAKENGLKTTLLTCKPASSGAKIADKVIVYKSIAEPYTYNTSTYLGMILSTTGTQPQAIRSQIASLASPKNIDSYTSYAFILPDDFLHVTPMITIKGDELFGPHLRLRAYTEGHARHAKFVHPWEKELVISLGFTNTHFGHEKHRWDVSLSGNLNYATVLAITYYICGLIQKAKPDYFRHNIHDYCSSYGPKAYGKDTPFEVIVPANS